LNQLPAGIVDCDEISGLGVIEGRAAGAQAAKKKKKALGPGKTDRFRNEEDSQIPFYWELHRIRAESC